MKFLKFSDIFHGKEAPHQCLQSFVHSHYLAGYHTPRMHDGPFTLENSDVTAAINKGQIMANVPELLCYAYISYFVFNYIFVLYI
jgi:hypothetical protein